MKLVVRGAWGLPTETPGPGCLRVPVPLGFRNEQRSVLCILRCDMSTAKSTQLHTHIGIVETTLMPVPQSTELIRCVYTGNAWRVEHDCPDRLAKYFRVGLNRAAELGTV